MAVFANTITFYVGCVASLPWWVKFCILPLLSAFLTRINYSLKGKSRYENQPRFQVLASVTFWPVALPVVVATIFSRILANWYRMWRTSYRVRRFFENRQYRICARKP